MPKNNLAARLIERQQAGVVVAPADRDALIAACRRLLDDSATRTRMAANGRRYAEANFAIGPIGEKFIALLAKPAATR
jgi:glycosyltransferase involved in cell wall biosynthesis